MGKPTSRHQVATANDLLTGISLFFGTDGQWHSGIIGARVSEKGEAANRLLDLVKDDEKKNRVVGCYLIDVVEENGEIVPVRFRERLRLTGPSVLANGLCREPAIAIRA